MRLNELGRTGFGAYAGAIASAGGFRAAIQRQLELEQAATRLAALTPPEHFAEVMEEATRRERHLSKTGAMESVAQDIMQGRWRFGIDSLGKGNG